MLFSENVGKLNIIEYATVHYFAAFGGCYFVKVKGTNYRERRETEKAAINLAKKINNDFARKLIIIENGSIVHKQKIKLRKHNK